MAKDDEQSKTPTIAEIMQVQATSEEVQAMS